MGSNLTLEKLWRRRTHSCRPDWHYLHEVNPHQLVLAFRYVTGVDVGLKEMTQGVCGVSLYVQRFVCAEYTVKRNEQG